jgi:hypothetical protein
MPGLPASAAVETVTRPTAITPVSAALIRFLSLILKLLRLLNFVIRTKTMFFSTDRSQLKKFTNN